MWVRSLRLLFQETTPGGLPPDGFPRPRHSSSKAFLGDAADFPVPCPANAGALASIVRFYQKFNPVRA